MLKLLSQLGVLQVLFSEGIDSPVECDASCLVQGCLNCNYIPKLLWVLASSAHGLAWFFCEFFVAPQSIHTLFPLAQWLHVHYSMAALAYELLPVLCLVWI